MTITHAESYLARLRSESAARKRPTKREAGRLSARALDYWRSIPVPLAISCGSPKACEWYSFERRVYDESKRLREIAEGKK